MRRKNLATLAGLVLVAISAFTMWSACGWPQQCSTTLYSKVKGDLMAIERALLEYQSRHDGRWPSTLDDLVRPDKHGRTYLWIDAVPLDPWGQRYVYEAPCEPDARPLVWSLGRDRTPGGEGEDADVGSWAFDVPESR